MENNLVSRLHTKRAFSLLLGIALLMATPAAQAAKVSIAATVNDDLISSTDVVERRALIMHTMGIPNTPENLQQATARTVQLLIDETLELQEAKRQSVLATDEDVTKAIDMMGVPPEQPGVVKKRLIAEGQSMRALSNQVKAQLSWTKVVQRKLRRNVIVTQDEVTRSQQQAAADKGFEEMRLAVMAINVVPPQTEETARTLSKQIADDLKGGSDMPNIAEKYRGKANLQYNPMLWVTEERTPPALFSLIKDKKPGELVGPVRTGNIIQFIKMMERRTTKKPSANTEVFVKQLSIEMPDNDKDLPTKLAQTKQILQNNPGSCDNETLTATPLPTKATFVRAKMSMVPPDQVGTLARMEVGQLSEPQVVPGKLQYLLLCERSESAGAAVGDDAVKQQVFAEKIELEAQKHLRNLRREATIDIRSGE